MTHTYISTRTIPFYFPSNSLYTVSTYLPMLTTFLHRGERGDQSLELVKAARKFSGSFQRKQKGVS